MAYIPFFTLLQVLYGEDTFTQLVNYMPFPPPPIQQDITHKADYRTVMANGSITGLVLSGISSALIALE